MLPSWLKFESIKPFREEKQEKGFDFNFLHHHCEDAKASFDLLRIVKK